MCMLAYGSTADCLRAAAKEQQKAKVTGPVSPPCSSSGLLSGIIVTTHCKHCIQTHRLMTMDAPQPQHSKLVHYGYSRQ